MDREAANYVLEDTRLSTLQRKLVKEGDESVALALALHINECLLYPENATYVSRSSDIIQDAVMEVVRSPEHSWQVKILCAGALGRVGSLHPNYASWLGWIWKQVDCSDKEKTQTLFMSALEESIIQGGGNKEGIDKLLETTKAKLEATHSELMMVSLLAVLVAASNYWTVCFKSMFTEVVDIVVGWFMESHNMPDIRFKIGTALISWGVFWQGEMDFAVEQVGYFMEDLVMETRNVPEDDDFDLEALEDNDEASQTISKFVYKWDSNDVEREDQRKAAGQALAFIQMIDCVLCGLSRGSVNSSQTLPLPKIGVWIEVIAKLGRSVLEWRWNEDMAVSWIKCLETAIRIAERNKIERYEERASLLADCVNFVGVHGIRMSWAGQRILFGIIHRLVASNWIGTDQVRSFIQTVLGERGILPQAFIQTRNPHVHGASIVLIKELLQSKNVVVLQEVYSLLCMRLEQALMCLNSSKQFLSSNVWAGVRMSIPMASLLALWVQACISKVATVSGSILSMWALDPSIFQLLATHSGILCGKLVRNAPSLHDNTVSLFIQHCTTHSYFLSSSSLLSPGSTSPTAGNFSQLIQILSKLQTWTSAPLHTRQLVIKKIGAMLNSIKSSSASLSVTQEFHQLLDSIIEVCYESSELCCDSMDNLLIILDDFPLPVPSLVSVTFLLLHVSRNGNKKMSAGARKLLAKIPPQITFSRERAKQLDCVRQAGYSPNIETVLLQICKLDINMDTLRSNDFKDFMHFVGGEIKDSLMAEGWRKNVLENVDDVPNIISTSERLQTIWLSWAAAQFCVLSKLRTPLGKAQDTLGHIDTACKKLALVNVEQISIKQAQALLDFAMGLEKAMVNGWEGSVAALPVANKSTQLFFYTNKATCQDWLARIRSNLMRIAFSVGQYSEAVRQAWFILPSIVSRGELEQPANMALIMILCLSLAKLDAKDHLTGLYTYFKDKSGTKLKWIQSIIDLVRKQTEAGVKSLQHILYEIEDGSLTSEANEFNKILKPKLEDLLYKGYESLSDHQTYLDWVKDYREKYQKEEGDSHPGAVQPEDKFLIALSKFRDGAIPVTAETLEPGQRQNQGSVVQHMLEDLQIHLLQAGACLQNTFMRSSQSWNENEKLSRSLSSANNLIDHLLTAGCVTESEQRKILMFNMICQELISIKERGVTMLARILKIEKGCGSSELLLIIKKWGEFFVRFRKNNPDFHYQISNINLEIARVARKEKNFGLSEKFLLKTLTGRTNYNIGLEDFLKNYDFLSAGVSHDRVLGLRQAAKVFSSSSTSNTRELAVKTVCGLVLGVGQYHANTFNAKVSFSFSTVYSIMRLM